MGAALEDLRMEADVENLKAQLDEQGYVLLKNVLTPKAVEGYVQRLNAAYRRLEDAGQHTYADGVGRTERLLLNVHNKDAAFVDLVDHPAVFPVIQHLLSRGSYQDREPFIVTQVSARDPHRDASAQQLHIDSRFPGSPYALGGIALWMMNDFTLQSGATRVVPGSHRRAEYPETGRQYPDEITVTGPAGSVLIYNASLWHGGGDKIADVERWAVIISYGRWFLKQAFDLTRNTPQALYEQLSPARRELFGFTSVPPYDEARRAKARTRVEELPADVTATYR
jgi:ectoine hydroxylase-related dioxygenase (phytanoyl-CoA dioxygenase family)